MGGEADPADKAQAGGQRAERGTTERRPRQAVPSQSGKTLRGPVPRNTADAESADQAAASDGAVEGAEAVDGGSAQASPGADTQPSPQGREAVPSADLGRYQLLFELARGGMGTVHVARLRGAHGFDRLVAIKKLHIKTSTEEDLAAFLSEARLSAQIRHPNVVQTIELGERGGLPFLVMELVEGVSLVQLQARLREQSQELAPVVAAWIVAQAATGLHAAHELCSVDGQPYGLVHRDVSPENVLLSFDGRVCVADFGVAKFTNADRRTRSGVVKGKFAYMSPEQTEAHELDRRSDIFSMGIVLHECLTGKPLFEGRNVPDTIRRIWSLEPVDPSTDRPEVPSGLVPIVMRCLEKERDDRYDTADQLARKLRAMLRKSGSAVDEADVADLLATHFPAQRDKLRQRIRDAIRKAEAAPATASEVAVREAADEERYGGQGSVAASVTTGPPLVARRLSGPVLLLGAVLLVALGWFALWGNDDSGLEAPTSAPEHDRTGAPSEASGAGTDSTPAAPSAPASQPSESPAVRSAPDAAALPRTGPGRLPTAARPSSTAATTSSVSPAAATSTPTSHKGVPFNSLDP